MDQMTNKEFSEATVSTLQWLRGLILREQNQAHATINVNNNILRAYEENPSNAYDQDFYKHARVVVDMAEAQLEFVTKRLGVVNKLIALHTITGELTGESVKDIRNLKLTETGYARRMDDLGRIALPREVRRILDAKEGSLLEMCTTMIDGQKYIVLKAMKPNSASEPSN